MSERHELSSEFDHMTEHLEQMWDHLLGHRAGAPGKPRFARPVLEPPTDVYQTDEQIVVLIELAGMRNEEVEIQLEGRRMTVRGKKLDRRVHNPNQIYNAMEIQYGPFERTIALPADVDPEAVAVQYDDGLLQISMPKRALQPQRRVRITVR